MWFPPSCPRLPLRAPQSWKGYCVPDEEGLITEDLYYIIGKGLCWGSSQLGTWLIVSGSFITAFNTDEQEGGKKVKRKKKVQSHAYGRGYQSHRFTFIRLLLSHSGCIFFRSQWECCEVNGPPALPKQLGASPGRHLSCSRTLGPRCSSDDPQWTSVCYTAPTWTSWTLVQHQL